MYNTEHNAHSLFLLPLLTGIMDESIQYRNALEATIISTQMETVTVYVTKTRNAMRDVFVKFNGDIYAKLKASGSRNPMHCGLNSNVSFFTVHEI